MSTENFYHIDEEGKEDLISENIIDEAPEIENLTLRAGEILRIEEKVTRRFSGVRSCSKPSTHASNASAAMNEWAKNKIFEHRGFKVY